MRIVIIGSGNVATNLAKTLCRSHKIEQIYSRTKANAEALAAEVGCDKYTDSLTEVTSYADLYIISVRDDAIASVVAGIPDNGALWVHTSGSKPMEIFQGQRKAYGVFYPMQSFSKQIETDFAEVPLFIEGNSEEVARLLEDFAKTLSHRAYRADSEIRRRLHIAAVFSCNFANHLWTLADDVLRESGLPFDVMIPLIRTTVDKLDKLPPAESQTGPAVRNDYDVISQHLSMLTGDSHEVYDVMSKSIIRYHNSKNKDK